MKIQTVTYSVMAPKTVTVPMIVFSDLDQSIRYNKESSIFEVCMSDHPSANHGWEQIEWAAWLEGLGNREIHKTLLMMAELVKVTCKLK
jgi:hypothetical protein